MQRGDHHHGPLQPGSQPSGHVPLHRRADSAGCAFPVPDGNVRVAGEGALNHEI